LVAALRRLRMTAAEIAEVLAMPLSTVSGILTGSDWAGSLAWSRSSRRIATSASGRASSFTST
jgi:DNA-binding IclR family transcriptional regulator